MRIFVSDLWLNSQKVPKHPVRVYVPLLEFNHCRVMRSPSVGSPLEVYLNFTDPRVKTDLVNFSIQFWPELGLIRVAEQDHQVPSHKQPFTLRSKSTLFFQFSLGRRSELASRLGLDTRRDLNCIRGFLALPPSRSCARSSHRTQFCTSIRETMPEASLRKKES